MNKNLLKKYLPLIIALVVALIVAGYYLTSGRNSLDQNVSQLEKTTTVEQVQTVNNGVIVKCKNGETYEVTYQPGQTNFQDLVFNKCGQLGVQSTQQQP